MPHGCRRRRTLSLFAAVLVAMVPAAGCQRLSGARLLALDFPPGRANTAAGSVVPETTATTVNWQQPKPQPEPQLEAVAPPAPGALLASEPRPQPADEPTPPVSSAPPGQEPAAPRLDAEVSRAIGGEPIAAAATPPSEPVPTVVPELAAAPEPAPELTPAPEPVAAPALALAPVPDPEPETKALPLLVRAEAQPAAPGPAPAPKGDLKVEAVASLAPDQASEPAPHAHPIDPDRPVEPAKPRDVWHEGVDRLKSVAHDRADHEEQNSRNQGLWTLRGLLLDWLDEPETLTAADRHEGTLLRTVLAAMAAATGAEPFPANTRAARIRAAVVALDERAPLEITELQLCRKVKGFGDFESLDAAACRPGHVVIVYCELGGLRYEREGDHYRSRLTSRVEVLPPGGGEPVWRHDLGPVGDLCRRRRRDYYVNYKLTLPESLPPGTYELRLIQDDLIAEASASRTLPLVIQP
jgi:hypothetical protein